MDNPAVTELLASQAYARARGVSPQRIRQLLAAGKVPGALRVGGRWVIPADAPILRSAPGRPPRSRAGILRRAARACEAALRSAGVRARVVGSLAYGDVRPESDLDLLVLEHPGRTWAQVQSIVSDAARPYGVPVDVIFAETLPAAIRRGLLKDARRAADL
jgi:predicted nucleotidyltransferase